MIKDKHIPWVVVIVLTLAFGLSYLIIDTKTGDRFTGTRGAVLESAVESIKSDVTHMSEMQKKVWARIECRQIVFIRSSDKNDFEQLRKQLKDECE